VNAVPARVAPLRYARTDTLKVAYFQSGPSDGDAALLLRGFPYDIHSYIDVMPRLVAAGVRHRALSPRTRADGHRGRERGRLYAGEGVLTSATSQR
jgi:hypothetical protein